jgi:hypothetical protein
VVCKPALPFEDRCAHGVRLQEKHNNIWHATMQYTRFNMQHDTRRSKTVVPPRPRPQALARVRVARVSAGSRRCTAAAADWAKASAVQVVRGPISSSAHEGEAAGD